MTLKFIKYSDPENENIVTHVGPVNDIYLLEVKRILDFFGFEYEEIELTLFNEFAKSLCNCGLGDFVNCMVHCPQSLINK